MAKKKLDLSLCKQTSIVYQTYDYDMFLEMEYNRSVSESRVNKLVASFSEKEIMNPIVINEKGEIVDGQGRYEALKRLGRPIKFVVSYGANINDCRRMNLYNTNWTIEDFVNSYVRQMNPNYIEFKKCHTETGVQYTRILRLVNKGRANISQAINSGKLEFNANDTEKVKFVVKCANEIREALADNKRVNDAFMVAVKVMIETEGYNHDRMLKKCAKERSRYSQMSQLEPMLREFSRIYNSHGSNKANLYFEDYMRKRGHNVRSYENVFQQGNTQDVKTLRKKK